MGRVGPAPLLGEDPRHLPALGVGVADGQVESVLTGEQGEVGS